MRIRSTKPEFWRSADTAALGYFTRLLFIGLWNYVDDNGVGEDDVNLIRSDLFPRDPVDEVTPMIHGALTELSLKGQITRYFDNSTGRRYLHVTNWHHQKINRPTASKKPLPTSDNVTLIEDSRTTHGILTEDSPPEQGIKGTREQGIKGAGAPRARASMDLTEQVNGKPATPPPPTPAEPQRGTPATLAADIVRDELPPNRYPAAVLTDLRLRVGQLLAEDNDEAVIRQALRLWDARDGGPGLLPHLLADAAKAMSGTHNGAPRKPTRHQEKSAAAAALLVAFADEDSPPAPMRNQPTRKELTT